MHKEKKKKERKEEETLKNFPSPPAAATAASSSQSASSDAPPPSLKSHRRRSRTVHKRQPSSSWSSLSTDRRQAQSEPTRAFLQAIANRLRSVTARSFTAARQAVGRTSRRQAPPSQSSLEPGNSTRAPAPSSLREADPTRVSSLRPEPCPHPFVPSRAQAYAVVESHARRTCPSRPARARAACSSRLLLFSLAASPIFEPPTCFWFFSPSLLRVQALQPRLRDCVVRRDRQSGIDIDMIRVIRRDRLQPDCLNVFSGYATDQHLAGLVVGQGQAGECPKVTVTSYRDLMLPGPATTASPSRSASSDAPPPLLKSRRRRSRTVHKHQPFLLWSSPSTDRRQAQSELTRAFLRNPNRLRPTFSAWKLSPIRCIPSQPVAHRRKTSRRPRGSPVSAPSSPREANPTHISSPRPEPCPHPSVSRRACTYAVAESHARRACPSCLTREHIGPIDFWSVGFLQLRAQAFQPRPRTLVWLSIYYESLLPNPFGRESRLLNPSSTVNFHHPPSSIGIGIVMTLFQKCLRPPYPSHKLTEWGAGNIITQDGIYSFPPLGVQFLDSGCFSEFFDTQFAQNEQPEGHEREFFRFCTETEAKKRKKNSASGG
uniref:Uncharacterized protein n=1 Tax=Cucumis melo TaxID=3656 RepID=A0A9I9EGI7_CUCME